MGNGNIPYFFRIRKFAVGLPLAGNGCIASKHEGVGTWCLFTWQRYRDEYAARLALPSFAFVIITFKII